MDTVTDVVANEVPTSQTSRPDRRRFLALGTGALGALAALSPATSADAQPPRGGSRGKPVVPSLTPGSDVSVTWQDPLLRLVRRLSYGLNPAEVALARQLGYNGYLEYHLRADQIDDTALEAAIGNRCPMINMPAATLKTQDNNEAVAQLADASWYRAAFAKAQLRERMVEFWSDHFNIDTNKSGWMKILDDRDVIRPNALGNFFTMLRASSQSPAMLFYLDQSSSRTPTPNQNYAREIMELHTLGVDGGYTQTDVAELSRMLTGYTYETNNYTFSYNRGFHDRNAKTFLGQTFPAMAATATAAEYKSEADTAITMLLNHPSTARFVSTKMARFLLAYDPPSSVIDATAAAYLRTQGDIKTMIRTILTSSNLSAAPAKFKRPFHLALSGMRALGMDATTVPAIRSAVRQAADFMGQPIFEHQQPDGYPDRVDWWSGLVVNRWNYMRYLSTLTANTARFDLTAFRQPDTAEGVVNQISTRLFAGEIPATLKLGLVSYLKGGTYNEARIRETLSLALSSNEFQWY
jgi:uncharacterized protein (DUF1800 family)